MAAMRSVLTRLCRRSFGNSGSSAAAVMCGTRVDIRQVIGSAAPMPPSTRPAAVRNLEGWRCFSTEGTERAGQKKPFLMKHRVESILRMLWQRSRDRVKNVMEADRHILFTAIGCATSLCFLMTFRAIHHSAFGSSTNTRIKPVHSRVETQTMMPFFMIPAFRPMYLNALGSTHTRIKPVHFSEETDNDYEDEE